MEILKIKIDYKLGFKAIDHFRKDLLKFVIIFNAFNILKISQNPQQLDIYAHAPL